MESIEKKVGLVYFSLTGNTKLITEKIGQEFSASDYTVSYYDIMDRENRKKFPLTIDPEFLARNDIIGFGCFVF
jgi:flavodoxin